MNNLVKQVDFYGDKLIAIKNPDTEKIYVGVSYVCKGIGFNKGQKDRQTENVQQDIVLKKGCRKFEAGVFDQNNSTIAIDINYLPLWLAKISITPTMQNEQPEIADKLINYQLKAKDVLAAAFVNKQLSPMDQLRLQYQVIEQHEEKLSNFDSRLAKVENNTTIDYSQQEELRNLGTKKVVAILGGSDAPAYKELNKKVFSSFWRDYKRKLNVNSYRNTLVKDFEIGRKVIIEWQPSKEIAFMIKGCNAQIRM